MPKAARDSNPDMWCVAAANDGRLPPLEDVAIKFRMPEPRVGSTICGALALLTMTKRARRHRERKRVTREGECDDTLASHPQNRLRIRTEQEQIGVTRHALVEVLDEAALRAWDDYCRLTTGKP